MPPGTALICGRLWISSFSSGVAPRPWLSMSLMYMLLEALSSVFKSLTLSFCQRNIMASTLRMGDA